MMTGGGESRRAGQTGCLKMNGRRTGRKSLLTRKKTKERSGKRSHGKTSLAVPKKGASGSGFLTKVVEPAQMPRTGGEQGEETEEEGR